MIKKIYSSADIRDVNEVCMIDSSVLIIQLEGPINISTLYISRLNILYVNFYSLAVDFD